MGLFDYTLSRPMSSQGLSIAEAARTLGVSTRTVRRYIKAGKISAELVEGRFGQEYRILELAAVVDQPKPLDNTTGQGSSQVIDIIKELQDKNLALAARLGAATERIRNLEGQVKLLAVARQPWWKRLFGRGLPQRPLH